VGKQSHQHQTTMTAINLVLVVVVNKLAKFCQLRYKFNLIIVTVINHKNFGLRVSPKIFLGLLDTKKIFTINKKILNCTSLVRVKFIQQ
ncbi:MAG: hypothetical protein ACR2LR_21605, partial [Hassallia sp.]